MPASPLPDGDGPTRIVVVGSGWRFLSGISYYTCRLSNALATRYEVGAILMRQLLPTRLYPGRARVGHRLNALSYDPRVHVFDGIDWWGVPSLLRAVLFLRSFRPEVLVLQWWTGAVLHSYLVLALAARALGIRVVVEFHEVQDTGEAQHRWATLYCRTLIKPLLRRISGVIVHSAFDRTALRSTYDLAGVPDEIALHGPFDHHERAAVPPARRAPEPASAPAPTSAHICAPSASAPGSASAAAPAPRAVPTTHDQVRLLFFGTIRPYKGLEDLVEAFGRLPQHYTLTVVGETWEGWTLPAAMIAASPAASRITFVNRYVADSEVDDFFAAADMVVLPYRRSSASGPLHIAMSHGLPVVVTAVGGLVEAASAYAGTTFVTSGSPAALGEAIVSATANVGRRHTDPSSWEKSVAAFTRLFARMGVPVAQDAEITASSNQTVPVFSPDLR
ncbi:sugar transferase [Paractinoplanes abujensis]|uniref:Glycosyltransferase involved in cell wall biosynthesis n=1 Tax=Paractinoplanes abujensis TaxID=882441 RepID=A0A7W7G4T3_9ACTN|nr:glycosyltransferase [Actinoplanes abujensis]MBB4697688.1 glycosyltransferase involved in cell wall biosynthesis [Actinoplanes abujensis]GID19824.1 sugar transferase [Actinoplanes abujensis]